MNLLNTLSLWQWIVLAAIPPAIVALYFLKLKRQPLEVPSTYLWSRTIEDLHVNTIWQRLRQSLLLFLQLLLIAMVILALLRPGMQGSELVGERFIFLVDTSASMSSTDAEPTRLEMAKRRLEQYIDQMRSGDAAMIISFSDTARVVQNYTDSRSQLRKRIQELRATNRPTDITEAMRAASGLANPGTVSGEGNQQVVDGAKATVYILSDGGFADLPDFFLGNLNPILVKIGEQDPNNVSIGAFSAERNPENPGVVQLFARVENHNLRDVTVQLELYLDENLVDATRISVKASDSQSATFQLPDLEQGLLRLVANYDDQLPLDNAAYLAINRSQRARVLVVTPGNEYLELALQTEEAARIAEVAFETPTYLTTKEYQDQAALAAFDLIIYDGCAPETMPQSNTFFFGQLPPGGAWKTEGVKELPGIIDVERTHPVMQYVIVENISIAEAFSPQGPEGSRTLIDSVIGPLLVVGPRQGFEDAVLGFSVFQRAPQGEIQYVTNWPLKPSFPVFLMNIVRYLGNASGITAGQSVRPGQPMVIRSDFPTDTIRVVAPGGERKEIRREGQNLFVYPTTEQLGVYEIFDGSGNTAARHFTVNLFDERESNLQPRDIEIGHEKVRSLTGSLPARREFWRWIVILGLGVLLFEWYIYNRRVYL